MGAQDHLNEDQFPRWATHHLVDAAHRVTPASEHNDWTATNHEGRWDGKEQLAASWYPARDKPGFEKYSNGEVIDRMDDDEMRENVTEQLQHYGIDQHEVNRMKS